MKDWVGGEGEQPELLRPHGVTVAGNALLIADPEAGFVHRFALGDSVWSRLPAEEQLALPVDAAVGPDGMVFISDSGTAQVAACDREGRLLFACEGPFVRPAGLAWDERNERLLIADAGAHAVYVADSEGRRLTVIGRRGAGPAEFNHPVDVAVGRSGEILVLDALNYRIQTLSAEGAYVREFGVQGDTPGHLARPRGLCVDEAGRIVVTDAVQDNFQIFDAEGRLLLAVGHNGHAPGAFWMPAGIAADREGRLYVADAYNRRVQVFAYLAAAREGAPQR